MSVTYPNSVSVQGIIYSPSIYAQDLDSFLIGSSGDGGVKFRIRDENALDIRAKTDTAGAITQIAATNNQSIEIVPADAHLTTVLGNLTLDNGTTATSNANYQVYSTAQTAGHFFEQPIVGNNNIRIQQINTTALAGSNTNVLRPTNITLTSTDDNSATVQEWTQIEMQNKFDSQGTPIDAAFRIRGPNASETGTYSGGTSLGVGTTVLQVKNGASSYNTNQLVLYGNGEVRADNFITSNLQTFQPSTNSMTFSASSFILQDNTTDILTIDSTTTNTTLTANDTNIFQIIPSDTDLTTILGNLTIDNGTTATSNANFQVYSTTQSAGHFFEQKINANTSLTVAGNNVVSGSNTAVLTPLTLTLANPDDNNGTTTRPQIVLQSVDVGGSGLNQFQIIGPNSQDTTISTGSGQGSLGGGKTVIQVNGSNAGYATDQLVLYGNGEVQALEFISQTIRSLNTDTDTLTYNASSHIFQDNATNILTFLDNGTYTSISAPAPGTGASRGILFEADQFIFSKSNNNYLIVNGDSSVSTITANTGNSLNLEPTNSSNTVILGHLTVEDGAVSPNPRQGYTVYNTSQPNGHWFDQPVNISQAQFNLSEPNPVTGSNVNFINPRGFTVDISDDNSASSQIWSDIIMQTTADTAGTPKDAAFRIRGPNASETGTYSGGTSLGVGTTTLSVKNGTNPFNTDQLVLYGNGEVRADNFITSNLQTFQPSTNSMTFSASSFILQDNTTDILTIDSTTTNTTLTANDTNIFQIIPSDTDLTTILGNLTIDNGTTATSNANFQVYSTSQSEGHFFEQKINANTSLTVSSNNAVAGSNTTVITPLSITINNPDDNNGTTTRPQLIFRNNDVGGNGQSQFQIIGPNSQDTTTDTAGTLGGGKTVLQVAGNNNAFASDQLVLYGNGEVQALNFITANLQTLDFTTSGTSMTFNARNYIFRQNSVDILTVSRIGTTQTSLTANTNQQFSIIPTDSLITTNIGSLSTYDGSSLATTNYQVLTTNSTNNPNGIFFDTAAIASSNIQADTLTGLSGSLLTIDEDAQFNSNVSVTGNINISGDVNVMGQINSTTVNNLDVNDFRIRLATPENPVPDDQKSINNANNSGLYIWTVPVGAVYQDAEDIGRVYDKSFEFIYNSGFSTVANPVSTDSRALWEVRPGNLRLTHVKSDLTSISMGLRVTDAEELQLYKFKNGVTTVMATFSTKTITTPVTDPN